MDGKSLRMKGPIGASDSGSNPGELQTEGKLFDVTATPHPDNESATNQQEKYTSGPPPKNGLGSRGHGGAA